MSLIRWLLYMQCAVGRGRVVNIAKLGAVDDFACIFGELVGKFRRRSDWGDSSSLSRIQTHRCRSAASSRKKIYLQRIVVGCC